MKWRRSWRSGEREEERKKISRKSRSSGRRGRRRKKKRRRRSRTGSSSNCRGKKQKWLPMQKLGGVSHPRRRTTSLN